MIRIQLVVKFQPMILFVNGINYTVSGVYDSLFTNINGCEVW